MMLQFVMEKSGLRARWLEHTIIVKNRHGLGDVIMSEGQGDGKDLPWVWLDSFGF